MFKTMWNWLFRRCKSDRESNVEEQSTAQVVTASTDLEPPSTSSSSSSRSRARGEPARLCLTSSVIQSSVVEDPYCTIPPVTQMLLGDTTGRLTRLLDKVNTLEWDSPRSCRKSD